MKTYNDRKDNKEVIGCLSVVFHTDTSPFDDVFCRDFGGHRCDRFVCMTS